MIIKKRRIAAEEDEIISEINMTPLVDVSLVLVIVFMIISPFVSQVLKPLLLPPSVRAAITENESLKVSLFADGEAAVGPSLVAFTEIESAVRTHFAAGKKAWAIVRADQAVPHGRVMQAVRAIKKAGATRIGFATLAPGGAR